MAVPERAGKRFPTAVPRQLRPGPGDREFANAGGAIQHPISEMAGAPKLRVGLSRTTTRVGKRYAVAMVCALALGAIRLPANARHMIASFEYGRAMQSRELGDIAASIKYLKRSLSFDPGSAEAHYDLAREYEELGADGAALKEYQQAIELSPHFHDAYYRAAHIQIARRRDYAAGLEVVERAFRQGPQEASVQYSLYLDRGWANVGLQLWDQAHRDLRDAIRRDPGRGGAHCLLAMVLEAGSAADRASSEWGLCAAMSNQSEVEPQWRTEAEQRLSRSALR